MKQNKKATRKKKTVGETASFTVHYMNEDNLWYSQTAYNCDNNNKYELHNDSIIIINLNFPNMKDSEQHLKWQ